MSAPEKTEAVRLHYDRASPRYDRQIGVFERILFGDGRRWVCSRAEGDILEIAAGTGRNFEHYPSEARVTAIELSPAMAEIARARADEVGRDAHLETGDAQALEFPDESFDTVLTTLSLCTIPDPRAAVSEVKRVLRPGGRFVFMEHVRSPRPSVRFGQRLLNPLMVRFEHDNLLREPLDYLAAEGFAIDELERSKLGIVERGVARKPVVAQ